jgi:hypothetical protein
MLFRLNKRVLLFSTVEGARLAQWLSAVRTKRLAQGLAAACEKGDTRPHVYARDA